MQCKAPQRFAATAGEQSVGAPAFSSRCPGLFPEMTKDARSFGCFWSSVYNFVFSHVDGAGAGAGAAAGGGDDRRSDVVLGVLVVVVAMAIVVVVAAAVVVMVVVTVW